MVRLNRGFRLDQIRSFHTALESIENREMNPIRTGMAGMVYAAGIIDTQRTDWGHELQTASERDEDIIESNLIHAGPVITGVDEH